MARKKAEAGDFILPLNINGLDGRLLRLAPKKKTNPEILFIYGQHSSLERWFGVAQELNKLGGVTMPDLPGLGGMTSLQKIGKTPSIDNMATYLATLIKLRFKNKKITIVAMSLGFVVVTRMLQMYPELTKKVNFLASIVGFAHHTDFNFSPARLNFYKTFSYPFRFRFPAFLFRRIALNPRVLKTAYHRTHNAKDKFKYISGDEFDKAMDMEINLWHINDVRTQFYNYGEMFRLDNTKTRINLPVHHVAVKNDRYFDNTRVEEHMRRIFSDFNLYSAKLPSHAPTVIATAKQAAPLFPPELRKAIKKKV